MYNSSAISQKGGVAVLCPVAVPLTLLRSTLVIETSPSHCAGNISVIFDIEMLTASPCVQLCRVSIRSCLQKASSKSHHIRYRFMERTRRTLLCIRDMHVRTLPNVHNYVARFVFHRNKRHSMQYQISCFQVIYMATAASSTYISSLVLIM